MSHGHGAGSGAAVVRLGERYNLHRFDNHSSWLDMEDRKKARREGRGLGHGYAEPVKKPPPIEAKPFYVQETSMTSGLMVNRRYDLSVVTQHKTEAERSDPHHFPNYMEVQDADHYGKFTRISQNLDKIQPNPEYEHLVHDSFVKMQVAAHKGESRSFIDPEQMKPLFQEGLRLQPDTLHMVNADLSCLELPHCEKPRASTVGRSSSTSASSKHQSQKLAAQTGEKWGWCMGGKKPLIPDVTAVFDKEEMMRSQTLPSLGKSLLPGMEGKEPGNFHGVAQGKDGKRTFGSLKVNPRMKGGSKAVSGWAGTAPFDPLA